jgi:hypothetical protein
MAFQCNLLAAKHPEMSKSESAFGAFYVHLQMNSRELLTFAADNHFEIEPIGAE